MDDDQGHDGPDQHHAIDTDIDDALFSTTSSPSAAMRTGVAVAARVMNKAMRTVALTPVLRVQFLLGRSATRAEGA